MAERRGTRLTLVPAVSRGEAAVQAVEEGRRLVAVLSGLSADQWQAATVCPPWTVRDMATHVLANHQGMASVREVVSQLAAALRRGGDLVDAMSATQIERRAGMPGSAVVQALSEAVPASVRARRRWPGVLRAARLPIALAGQQEWWSLAYLHDVIYTRDAWMHRMDICRAVGIEPELDRAHDGALVQRVVQEWADRHGQAYRLELTGPAGGSFSGGSGEPVELSLDTVEFCRNVAGRGAPEGLLAVPVGY